MINMRNIDLWEAEREKTVIEGGLRVLRSTSTVRSKGELVERPSVKVWLPKAKNPFMNHFYASVERREECISTAISNYKRNKEDKQKRKDARKGTPEMLDKIKEGDIFHESWGYDQTNNNYYQVVSRKGRHVEIREISQIRIDGTEGHMSCNVKAAKDSFLEDSPVMKKLIQFNGETPYLKVRGYSWCSLWDGSPDYDSWYA